MGLGIAISGSIAASTLFFVMTVFPAISDNMLEFQEAQSEISEVKKSLEATEGVISSINAKVGRDVFDFRLTNTGSEKLWDYDNFNVIINYDADVNGTSTKVTEFQSYNDTSDIVILRAESQFARPDLDITFTAGWDDDTGNNNNILFDDIDEISRNDADYIHSRDLDGGHPLEFVVFRLSKVIDPDFSSGHILRYAYAKELPGGMQIDLTVRLLQGVTEIASWTHDDVGATFLRSAQILTAEQTDAITDYSDLRLVFEASCGVTCDDTKRQLFISFAEFEVPSVGIVFARPDSDVSKGNWDDKDFGNDNNLLFDELDEVTRDDTDLVNSDDLQDDDQTEVFEVALSDVSDPNSSSDHKVKYVYRKDVTGGNTIDFTAKLLQNSTEIGSWTHSDIGDAFVQANQTLTAIQADSITDYNDLRLEFTAQCIPTCNGGGQARIVHVTWAEMEFTDTTIGVSTGLDKGEWGIASITTDVLDPGIINPNEFATILVRLQYPIYFDGALNITITSENGQIIASSDTVQCEIPENFARPNVDIQINNWEDTTGGDNDGSLFDELDEVTLDDVDYVSHPTPFTSGIIEFDSATSFNGNCNPCTFSHTVSSIGNDRILVVGVSVKGGESVSGVLYGGQTMSEIRSDNDGGSTYSSLWYRLDPLTGANDVVIGVSSAAEVASGAISLFQVEQSAPTIHNGASGKSNTPSVSITTVTDDAWIIDTVGTLDGPMTAGADQTERWEANQGSTLGAGSIEETTTSGSHTMSWTNAAGSKEWSISAVELKPSPSGGGGDSSEGEVALTDIIDPETTVGHELRLREQGKTNRDVNILLLQGSNIISNNTFSSSNSFQTREISLSSSEADGISDYSDLRVRWKFIDNSGSGNSNVSWIEFQVPQNICN